MFTRIKNRTESVLTVWSFKGSSQFMESILLVRYLCFLRYRTIRTVYTFIHDHDPSVLKSPSNIWSNYWIATRVRVDSERRVLFFMAAFRVGRLMTVSTWPSCRSRVDLLYVHVLFVCPWKIAIFIEEKLLIKMTSLLYSTKMNESFVLLIN